MCILSIILFSVVAAATFENSLKDDKMYILIGEDIFPINLISSPINTDLISILPLKTKLVQQDTVKAHLQLKVQIDTALSITDLTSSINCQKGDVLLYQGAQLVIIKESTTINNESGDYIKLGNCPRSEELMNNIEATKSILLWNSLNYENHEGKVKPYGNYNSIMNYFTWKIFTFFCFLLI
jgi:hypothetical protein